VLAPTPLTARDFVSAFLCFKTKTPLFFYLAVVGVYGAMKFMPLHDYLLRNNTQLL